MTLAEIADATDGKILAGSPSVFAGGERPGGISIDSRSIDRGEWFVALKGKTDRDGHEFLCNAVGRGAAGLIVSNRDEYAIKVGESYPDLPALLVSDTTIALGDIARAMLEKFNPCVIAITGTVGKTSVKENVAHIASTRWPVLKNRHNWNTEIGLPLTIFDLTPTHRVAVLECASRGEGQIRYLSMIARPHIAVITAIGPGHLSEFGTIDDVAKAKWEIVDGLRDNGVVVANGDSPWTKEFRGSRTITTFGSGNTNDVHPIDTNVIDGKIRCTFETPSGNIETTIPGTTYADLINALCSAACAINFEIVSDGGSESISPEEIGEALKTLPSIPGRMERMTRPSGIDVIFDAYNSNPISLANALEALASVSKLSDGSEVRRHVAILGDMLELGEFEEEYHREAGRHIADLPVDCLITVGRLAGLIRESANNESEQEIEGEHFETTEECAKALKSLLRVGDVVLIKASRSLTFERLLDTDW